MRVTFLGTGTAHGVPYIGCKCSVCQSDDNRNRRTRSSVLVEYNDRNILIDTTPDLREQALRNNIDRIDAILITHTHADHIHGLDDVRAFNFAQQTNIPIYASKQHLKDIRKRFDYIFYVSAMYNQPSIIMNEIKDEFELFGRTVTPLRVKHGSMNVYGYRIGDFAYITDAKEIPKKTKEKMGGLETLVLNCIGYNGIPTHLNLEEALSVIEKIKPERAYLTHMGHEFDYERLCRELPEGVMPAYDSLVIDL